MPKKFYIFKAEDVYPVSGNTPEDIWVSHPVGPFAIDKKPPRRHRRRMRKPNMGKSKTASRSAMPRPRQGGLASKPGAPRRPTRPSKMMKEVGPC